MGRPNSFRLLRTALTCVPVLAVAVLAGGRAQASAGTEWTVGSGGSGFDGSVVVQALPDASVISATKHSFGPGGSISFERRDAEGSQLWSTSVAEDPAGNFYGTELVSAVMLNAGTVLFTGYSDPDGVPGGHFDALLYSVTTDGVVSLVDRWGGAGSDFGRELTVCADGSFYVGGGSWDASPSPAETAAIGMADIFVTRFGADMRRQWTRVIGSTNNDNLYAMKCRADDGVDLNAWAAGSVNGQGSNDYYNFFTARMDATGVTTRTIVTELDPGEWNPQGGAYAPDGSYYVVGESNAGYFRATCTEWALGGSFVSHYSADGNLLWRDVLPCANLNRKIAVGASGDLFVTGTASGRRIAGQQKFGGDDMLIHRYAPTGQRLWTRQFGSSADDVLSSMSLDATGHLYLGGYTKGTYGGYTPVDDWDALVMRVDVADVIPTTTTLAPGECTAAASTLLPESTTPRAVWFYGDDIGEQRMAALWEYASTHTPRDFGRVVAAGQGWFGSCRYPGVGLGTGSGDSWHDRNVVLWMWADEVDLALARATIIELVDSLLPPVAPAPTTSTTTTTTTTTTTVPFVGSMTETAVAPLTADVTSVTSQLAPVVAAPVAAAGVIRAGIVVASPRKSTPVGSPKSVGKKATKTKKPLAPRKKPRGRR